MNREALESDIVTRGLHCWIDLIFGCLQRGEGSVEHNNVFHPLTYLQEIDEANLDNLEKKAMTVQVMEYGQVPSQLFLKQHPKKHSQQSHQIILENLYIEK